MTKTDNTISYFLISSKTWKWKQHFHTGITYFWIWLFGAAKYQWRDETKAKSTYEQPLSDKPPLIQVPGSSNLKVQHKVKEIKEKYITSSFLKLKANEKQISSESSGRQWIFWVEFRSFLSKLMFTQSASCWSRSHGVVET